MPAAQDFNYKVALASGLKSLQSGRLRQAEEQFRYLTAKFPAADGGYRGLARVLIELEDRAAALATLRDGAAALSRRGERSGAIALLREAVALDPHDLASHRRLAAALALAGQSAEAADEYRRFADQELVMGDPTRARIEVAYAIDTLGAIGPLAELAGRLGVQISRRGAERAPLTEADRTGLLAANSPAPIAPPTFADVPPAQPPLEDLSAPPVTAADAVPPSSEVDWRTAALAQPLAEPEAEPEPLPEGGMEEQAAALIAARDPRAADAALRAARAHLAEGRTHAASDLLLHLVASRIADHDAQRLLVDVAKSIGRREVAKAKCQLLAEALRLAGRGELATEVEALAEAV